MLPNNAGNVDFSSNSMSMDCPISDGEGRYQVLTTQNEGPFQTSTDKPITIKQLTCEESKSKQSGVR